MPEEGGVVAESGSSDGEHAEPVFGFLGFFAADANFVFEVFWILRHWLRRSLCADAGAGFYELLDDGFGDGGDGDFHGEFDDGFAEEGGSFFEVEFLRSSLSIGFQRFGHSQAPRDSVIGDWSLRFESSFVISYSSLPG